MLKSIIKSILLGAIIVSSVSALEFKEVKVSHPDFDITADGTLVVKN